MALSARLYISGGSPDYKLKADSFSFTVQRNPLQAGLVAGVNPILNDLGYFVPIIVLTGVIDTVSPGTDSDGKTIPSIENMEDFCTTESSGHVSDTVRLDLSVAPAGSTITATYTVKVRLFTYTMESAKEDKATFRLELVSVARA